MGKKRGRPPKPKDEIAAERIELRAVPVEKAQWDAAAERAVKSLSAWIRDRLNRAAKRELKRD